MKTESFTQLVRAVTGRDFSIYLSGLNGWRELVPAGDALQTESAYLVIRTLPLTGRVVGFEWKTPKTEEKMLRSFITAFTSKYREPNPATYGTDPYYPAKWESFSPEKREHAYGHHASHMFSKEELLAQVEKRFSCPEIETALNQWGFYETEYGLGIFCYWETPFVRNAIDRMRRFLAGSNVPAREEYSDARWVYRFRVEVSRDFHSNLLRQFCAS